MDALPPQPSEDNVLGKTFKLIVSTGTLVSGTEDHDTIKRMIQGWIGQFE